MMKIFNNAAVQKAAAVTFVTMGSMGMASGACLLARSEPGFGGLLSGGVMLAAGIHGLRTANRNSQSLPRPQ